MTANDGAPPAMSGEVMDDAYSGPGEWVPPHVAAARIGISERTLWRRVAAGLWRRRIEKGKAEVYVPLSGTVPTAEEKAEIALPAAPDTGLTRAVVTELQRRLEADTARLTDQAARIAQLEREAGRIEAERDAARAELAELRARRPWWRWW